jgi:hypothetical protein
MNWFQLMDKRRQRYNTDPHTKLHKQLSREIYKNY